MTIAFLLWYGSREDARFTKYLTSLGVNPEYVASNGNARIVIDKTNEKIFVGAVKNGHVLEFSEISSIQWEDRQRSTGLMYQIHINTRDFDLPQLTISLGAGSIARDTRDQAYQKLRVALNIG